MEEEDDGDDDWGIINAGWSTLDLQWMSYLESSHLESGATTMMNTAIATRLETSSHHDDKMNNKNKMTKQTTRTRIILFLTTRLTTIPYSSTSTTTFSTISVMRHPPPSIMISPHGGNHPKSNYSNNSNGFACKLFNPWRTKAAIICLDTLIP